MTSARGAQSGDERQPSASVRADVVGRRGMRAWDPSVASHVRLPATVHSREVSGLARAGTARNELEKGPATCRPRRASARRSIGEPELAGPYHGQIRNLKALDSPVVLGLWGSRIHHCAKTSVKAVRLGSFPLRMCASKSKLYVLAQLEPTAS
jgi:hypothetical protein